MGLLCYDGHWCSDRGLDHVVRRSITPSSRHFYWCPRDSTEYLTYRWAHEICSLDNEERAIVTGAMNQMAYVFQMFLPLVIWQQVDAPQYKTGFITITFLNVVMIALAMVTLYLQTRSQTK